jgi:hypothetical protein
MSLDLNNRILNRHSSDLLERGFLIWLAAQNPLLLELKLLLCESKSTLINALFVDEQDDKTTGEEHIAKKGRRFKKINSRKVSTVKMSQELRIKTTVNTANIPGTNVRAPIVVENRPASLKGAPGNLRFVPGEHMKNATGVAALFAVMNKMFGSVVEDPNGITEEDFREFRELRDFIGTDADVFKYVESFQAAAERSGPSRFAVFSQDSTTPSRPLAHLAKPAEPFAGRSVPRRFANFSQSYLSPSPPTANEALLAPLPVPRKRSRFQEELEEEELEEERRIAATSKDNWQ